MLPALTTIAEGSELLLHPWPLVQSQGNPSLGLDQVHEIGYVLSSLDVFAL
jgi:hypothetical protein